MLAQRHGHPLAALEPVVSADEVRALQRAVEDVYVDELILRWTVELVRATREVEGVAVGASVRGSLTLERTARAWALLHGRDHVAARGHRAALPAGARPPAAAHLGVPRRDPRARPRRGARQMKERCLELAPPPGAGLGQLTAWPARERRTFPLVPRRRADRAAVRRPAEPPPRPRQRGDRLAAVRARRSGLDDRLVRDRAALRGDAAATSSSCATAPPTRRRASRSSSTAGRRWASIPPPLPWLDEADARSRGRDGDRRRAPPPRAPTSPRSTSRAATAHWAAARARRAAVT